MSIRNNKKFMTMMVVMIALVSVLAFSGAAYATPALYVIGSSGCQVYDASLESESTYGIDPTLPVIIAFDDDVSGVTLTTADFTFVDESSNNVSFSVYTSGIYGMDEHCVALVPSSTLSSDALYTIGFADDLAGNASFEFKTKTPGGGGGTATLRCCGRIIDDFYTNEQAAPYVSRDQQFMYAFTNAITSYASTNDDAIHLYKFIGNDSTAAYSDTNNWQAVSITVSIDTSDTTKRWYAIVNPNSTLDANSLYAFYIGAGSTGGMRANNGIYLGDAVNERFTTGN